MVRKVTRVIHYDEMSEAHELTFSCLGRKPFFEHRPFCELFCVSLRLALERYSYSLWAYVIMPTHVHLLVWPEEDVCQVQRILRGLKFSSGRRCLGHVRKHYPERIGSFATGQDSEPYSFWLSGPGYDRNIVGEEALRSCVGYIHNNPVRKGLVEKAVDWEWSSARDWAGICKGPVHVNKETFPVV